MNREQKERYMKRYKEKKANGDWFFPDVVFDDVIVWVIVFIIMLGLAVFVGVHQEPPVNPSDTAYVPTPEWYFLFLYQYLKYWPGSLELVAAIIIPGVAILALILLPFYDTNPHRHWRKRPVATTIMTVVIIAMVFFTAQAMIQAPRQEAFNPATNKAALVAHGKALFAENCAVCHGENGKGNKDLGTNPLNSPDVLKTRDAQTIHNIISYGQQSLGMQSFGAANGGELSDPDIDAIVAYIQSWAKPATGSGQGGEQAGGQKNLAAIEHPSFSKDIEPLFKKSCSACHSAKKASNDWDSSSYDSVMNTGKHKPVIKAGDPNNSILVQMLKGKTEYGRRMPLGRTLKEDQIQLIERWIADGAPNN